MTRLPKPGCVIKVGDGRGFIIPHRVKVQRTGVPKSLAIEQLPFMERRLLVTAAHCLPHLPPAHAMSYTQERTYANLLGTVGGGKNTVCAECLFVDPIADIAVLGGPDNQDAYDVLVEDAPVVRISSKLTVKGWVPSYTRREAGEPWLLSTALLQ